MIEASQVATAIANAVEHDKREITVPWFPYRLLDRTGAAARATRASSAASATGR